MALQFVNWHAKTQQERDIQHKYPFWIRTASDNVHEAFVAIAPIELGIINRNQLRWIPKEQIVHMPTLCED